MISRCVVLVALAGSAASGGPLYDVAANFNSPNNPLASSTFSYWMSSGSGSGSELLTGSATCLNPAAGYCWSATDANNYTSSAVWNASGVDYADGSIRQPADQVRLDPQGTAGTLLRFTAPETSTYSLAGSFQSNDLDIGWGVVVQVFADGSILPGTAINKWNNGTVAFSFASLALNAGQTIDFVVTPDSRGYAFNGTGLKAQIGETGPDPAVPEPATLLLGVLALPALLLRRRAR